MLIFYDKDQKPIRYQLSGAIKMLEQTQELKDGYISNILMGELEHFDENIMNTAQYVAITSPDTRHEYETYDFFYIKGHEINNNILSFTAVDAGIEELSKTPIYDRRFRGYQANKIIPELLKGTNWESGYIADTSHAVLQFYYENVFDCLRKICQTFNLEMQFVTEVKDNGIGARYIDFKKKLGENSGARITYGKNGIEVIKETDQSTIYTAFIGRGKGEEVSTAEENAEKNDTSVEESKAGYGRKINFSDIEWSVANGDPVDKPLGQQYVEYPQATATYGIKTKSGQLLPKIGFIDFEEEEDKENLLKRTYEALLENSRPKVQFRTTTAQVKGNIADTVRVVRPDINLDYNTRIYKVVWDRRVQGQPRAITVELGDRDINGGGSSSHILKSASNMINNQLISFGDYITGRMDQIPDDLVASNNFNRNYFTEQDPRETGVTPKKGDAWWQPDPDHEGETKLYMWDGDTWVLIFDTSDKHLVADEINANKEALDKLSKDFENKTKDALDKIDKQNQDLLDKIDDFELHPENTEILIGKPSKITYGDNLIDGKTNGKSNNHIFTINSQDGIKQGETYTLSFKANCLYVKPSLFLTFDYENDEPIAEQKPQATSSGDLMIRVIGTIEEKPRLAVAFDYDHIGQPKGENGKQPSNSGDLNIKVIY